MSVTGLLCGVSHPWGLPPCGNLAVAPLHVHRGCFLGLNQTRVSGVTSVNLKKVPRQLHPHGGGDKEQSPLFLPGTQGHICSRLTSKDQRESSGDNKGAFNTIFVVYTFKIDTFLLTTSERAYRKHNTGEGIKT